MFSHTPSNTLNSCHRCKTPAISNTVQTVLNCLLWTLPPSAHVNSRLSDKYPKPPVLEQGHVPRASLGSWTNRQPLTWLHHYRPPPDGYWGCIQQALSAFPFPQQADSAALSFSHLFNPLGKTKTSGKKYAYQSNSNKITVLFCLLPFPMVFFLNNVLIYLCLLWAVSAASRGYSPAVVHSLLAAAAALVAELGL